MKRCAPRQEGKLSSFATVMLFGLLVTGAITAFAQDNTGTDKLAEISKQHLNTAYETVFITRISRTYSQVVPGLAARAKVKFTEKYPVLGADISKAVDEVALSLVERQGELDLLIARSWAEQFSEVELKEISAFYATPTGSKLAKANRKLIETGFDVAEAWSAKMARELIAKVQLKLKSQGHKL